MIILLILLIMPSLLYSHKPDTVQDIFFRIYKTNFWKDRESHSGSGSNLKQTKKIQQALPELLKKLDIKIILDAPCGDFYWMKEIIEQLKMGGLEQYIGIDIVPDLVAMTQQKYGTEICRFVHMNLLQDQLPYADLILCRDCLVHFSYEDICKALKRFKVSGAKYLLITTFPNHNNVDIKTGAWRPLNLQKPPFNFPQPIVMINEECTEFKGKFTDKSLGLWLLDEIEI